MTDELLVMFFEELQLAKQNWCPWKVPRPRNSDEASKLLSHKEERKSLPNVDIAEQSSSDLLPLVSLDSVNETAFQCESIKSIPNQEDGCVLQPETESSIVLNTAAHDHFCSHDQSSIVEFHCDEVSLLSSGRISMRFNDAQRVLEDYLRKSKS